MKELKDQDSKSPLAQAAPYMGLGVQLAATIVIMVFLGKYIDGKFNTGSLWTLILAFVGCGAGLYNFIKTALDFEKKNKK